MDTSGWSEKLNLHTDSKHPRTGTRTSKCIRLWNVANNLASDL